MIKQSNLLKWAQNNKNNSKNGTNKSWIHPPDALQHGHVAYLVKFLGSIEVDSAKGIDVVKDGIRKLKFNQQLKKAEGTKTPKVEVTISIDGVAIQDKQTKQIFHQYPLHRISYCANDKSDKKFFSFIAKEENSDKHMCFVFASDKLAEDITLTIGEAFDLAYRKFLDTSGRDLEAKKQLMIFQKRVQDLEKENSMLKQRLAELSKGSVTEHKNVKNGQMNQNLLNLNGDIPTTRHQSAIDPGYNNTVNKNVRNEMSKSMPPTSPSQELFNLVSLPITTPAVGTKLENLCLDDLDDFNPRQETPITNGNKANGTKTDIFGAPPFNPFQTSNNDPFGMGDFNSVATNDLENAIGELDKKISEMRDGFQRGISFGNEDFFDSAESH
ncbi:PTB domain-containing engulfment adapter protein 1 [Araneus ventricosus]|uniref:PTB domain-containing engulfment adapter protein 1 n=1 Tax=Araneus ventricosus TaxID=182803 RepID=A0A4Y2EQ54_ARAVE|nr:PTB domain-containing engulfment adapter protein 1 [Araneus ventricosus]